MLYTAEQKQVLFSKIIRQSMRTRKKSVCTHPDIEMIPGNNIGWCKTCYDVIRGTPDAPASKAWQTAEAAETPKPGQYITANNGERILVTRIDLFETNAGLVTHKFAIGWHRHDHQENTDLGLNTTKSWTLDVAVAWLVEHGYTVRRWPGGARAWLGRVYPIRNKAQIIQKQNDMIYAAPDNRIRLEAVDLAFDL